MDTKIHVSKDRIDKLQLDVKELSLKIDNMGVKLDKILELLDTDISQNCKKMGNHINFVENIYDNVKYPLEYVCNRFNSITGEKDNLQLENKIE